MEWIDEVLSDGVLPDELPAEPAPAADIDEVNRLLRRLRAVRTRRAETQRIALKEIGRIKTWQEQQVGPLDHAEEHILGALEAWMRADYGRSGVQTHKLPFGELKLRGRRSSVQVIDEAAAIEWLTKHGAENYVRVERSIYKDMINDSTSRGEVVDEYPDAGVQDHDALFDLFDPETAEIVPTAIPGIVLRQRLDGVAGMTFDAKVTDTNEPDIPFWTFDDDAS